MYLVTGINFKDYLIKKGITFQSFIVMKPDQKEKIFLLWKWGGSEHSHNVEAERARAYCVGNAKDHGLENISDIKERRYWQAVLRFEVDCLETKKQIGLIKSEIKDERVEAVRKLVGGTIAGWQE
ncbi:MAG TPA: hypothetical protein V6D12_14325 [Candidatus Obscuribacterales bacterium]